MRHVMRMTGMHARIARTDNHPLRAYRESPSGSDVLPVLQALRENQRLLREITPWYRMPRRIDHAAAWTSAAAPTICCPSDVAALLGDEMSTLIQEQLRILLLDTKSRVLGCEIIYQGTIHSISIRAAEVLRPAVLANAPALIVVHNHPSGDPSPSDEDVKATKTLMAAGELIDIDVLDHVVLGHGGRYASFRERGLVPNSSSAQRNRATAA